jgi:hypothetical protein
VGAFGHLATGPFSCISGIYELLRSSLSHIQNVSHVLQRVPGPVKLHSHTTHSLCRNPLSVQSFLAQPASRLNLLCHRSRDLRANLNFHIRLGDLRDECDSLPDLVSFGKMMPVWLVSSTSV